MAPLPLGIILHVIESTADSNYILASNRLLSEAIPAPCCLIIALCTADGISIVEVKAGQVVSGLFVRLQHVSPRLVNCERFVIVPFTNKSTAPSHIGCRWKSAHIVGLYHVQIVGVIHIKDEPLKQEVDALPRAWHTVSKRFPNALPYFLIITLASFPR